MKIEDIVVEKLSKRQNKVTVVEDNGDEHEFENMDKYKSFLSKNWSDFNKYFQEQEIIAREKMGVL